MHSWITLSFSVQDRKRYLNADNHYATFIEMVSER